MNIFILFLLASMASMAETDVWTNQSNSRLEFSEAVNANEGQSISEYELDLRLRQAADSSLLLAQVDSWDKSSASATQLYKEFKELQTTYLFNADNRLILFEYFKSRSNLDHLSFKTLCHLYANDSYLRTAEPFFDSSCNLKKVQLKEMNPILSQFDYMLVDGNKIDIHQSPYFFTAGLEHKFVFISDRYVTKDVQTTSQGLKQATISLEPWIDGTCDTIKSERISISNPVRIYFSKDCIKEYEGKKSESSSFVSRNKYYILTGLLMAAAAAYLSSEYELGISLTPP